MQVNAGANWLKRSNVMSSAASLNKKTKMIFHFFVLTCLRWLLL